MPITADSAHLSYIACLSANVAVHVGGEDIACQRQSQASPIGPYWRLNSLDSDLDKYYVNMWIRVHLQLHTVNVAPSPMLVGLHRPDNVMPL